MPACHSVGAKAEVKVTEITPTDVDRLLTKVAGLEENRETGQGASRPQNKAG